jgi:hypothetical protein
LEKVTARNIKEELSYCFFLDVSFWTSKVLRADSETLDVQKKEKGTNSGGNSGHPIFSELVQRTLGIRNEGYPEKNSLNPVQVIRFMHHQLTAERRGIKSS